ncbi:2, 3, 4, 5-tetrahydropyridine-2, 6-dicarboxylate N-succinyltransferase [Blattabacterium sp. (Mastotermes darwiniensis) str. MADAR]|jgi:2,3,4,5-tetrahydropyridine-2-carboxylate N-succinyltransferase|uniref:2,3,4,5-tetrahydropyridine-2,6-dicarboxylate N-succinyltransferase n=1 Tax=Blattabacterium sp. (Mastotermes darwiniensis) TaxID=39768 RepID=UPI000231DDC6|nr:2, 3, 4, 5-tetrahydropyridine-2, 6-dicarboxylate N-succinyltransferase [Blattabacterium sp. (Mastotermes darwiniensis) str. MADAR]
MNKLKLEIEKAWNKETWSTDSNIKKIVIHVIDYVEQGLIRVSESRNGKWRVNEWIKKAIIMYFSIKRMNTIELGPLEFYDKIPIKNKFKEKGIRVVPHAIARYGSYISPGVILMPSYVNIGAYIGEKTMIDTWATIGSCAQVGKRVHISGGVGIGGVLEPIQKNPVIIEDDVFVGSRCILVEGILIEKEAVLGANVVITSSTKIFDVTNEKPIEMKGVVPKYSVVIPGSYPKKFPSGIYHIPCAMIIGKRKYSTNKKTSLNEVLRTHHIVV